MKQLLSKIAFLSISFFVIACSNSANESGTGVVAAANKEEVISNFDLAAVRKIIDSTNAQFSALAAKGDSISIANLYTTDAKLLMHNLPAFSGRNNIQRAFGMMITSLGSVNISFTTLNIWGTEALVAEEGTFTLSDKEDRDIDNGKYIVLWKKEDGKWKLFRDIFNSDNPASGSH